MEKPWNTDVAVLLIFFVRHEQFKQTFAQVKKARPRTLLLYQDGPRDQRPEDIEGIRLCREIAEDIDWQCDVYFWYQDKNFGCDPSTFMAQKWAFSIVDKCIILEDDVVVNQSCFRFCKELLDKYENDERIDRICCQNHLGEFENDGYSYFFSDYGSACGWASWRRVAKTWEEDYSFLNKPYYMDLIRQKTLDKREHDKYVAQCCEHRKNNIAHWEKILSFSMLLNSRLVIIPGVNMVKNIGVAENATHSTANVKEMPHALQKIFYMDTHEIDFPLRHPPYIIADSLYTKKVQKILSNKNPFIRLFRKIESVFLRLKYGNYKSVYGGIKRRLKNLTLRR